MNNFILEAHKRMPTIEILEQELMSKHTTFRIGGTADYFCCPSLEELPGLLELAREYELPVTVIGNGSNLLVSDRGIRGLVIEIGSSMSQIEQKQEIICVQAGALLSKVARIAAEQELTGMEGLAGIPGTIGGAVVMNAGAYGYEMKDIIQKVKTLTFDGEYRIYSLEDLDLSYRHSAISSEKEIVVEVTLRLDKGEKEMILSKMEEYKKQRIEKQPLNYPSAGSTFKRPEGYFAGKLIMDAGLRGYTVGQAQVSQKHCGFVVNLGNATAEDVRQLMSDVNEKVTAEFGVSLEPEVRMLGEF